MVKNNKSTPATSPEAGISIIGMGMMLKGECETDGALRIEGTVNGDVHAGKAVVIGKEGLVDGNIYTQDAVIAGRVLGSVHASRLELQSTGYIEGEVVALRMQLAEGATLTGQVSVGESQAPSRGKAATRGEGAVIHGQVSVADSQAASGGQASARKKGAPEGTPEDGRREHVGAFIASASTAIRKALASPGWPKPRALPATSPGMNPDEQPTLPPAQGEGRPSQMPQQPPTTRPT